MSWVVVAYFTAGTAYEEEARRLIPSLQKFNIPYFVQPVSKFENWYRATQWKPTFLKNMLQRFPNKSIIYVDVDAEFLQYPNLFDVLDQRPDVHVGVHLLDHAKRKRPQAGFEMLSGTIFFRNSQFVQQLVDVWIQKCSVGGALWDQVALKDALGSTPYYVLPEEYCMIFDYMADVRNPVIVHYQASRKNREVVQPDVQNIQTSELVSSGDVRKPRTVASGFIRFHRPPRITGHN